MMKNVVYLVIQDSEWLGFEVLAAFTEYDSAMECVKCQLEEDLDGVDFNIHEVTLED